VAAAGASVLCCIDDGSASSRSALRFSVSMAGRRDNRDGTNLVVVFVHRAPLFVVVDPVLDFEWLGAGADVKAMIDEVSAYPRVAIRYDEIAGWSQPDIARIAVAWGSDAVVLPMLHDDAGPLRRWRRRGLVSGLIARTRAVVMDEYGRPFVSNL
jgi:uncharacterized protein CbrC (UPF0167 family)